MSRGGIWRFASAQCWRPEQLVLDKVCRVGQIYVDRRSFIGCLPALIANGHVPSVSLVPCQHLSISLSAPYQQ